jgi:hypothetical protein
MVKFVGTSLAACFRQGATLQPSIGSGFRECFPRRLELRTMCCSTYDGDRDYFLTVCRDQNASS